MKLNVYGPINDFGYGVHTKEFALGLSQSSTSTGPLDVSLIPTSRPEGIPPDDERIRRLLSKGKASSQNEISIGIRQEWNLTKFPGSVRIGFPVFETTRLSDLGIDRMKQMDRLFVPSGWAREVCRSNGISDGVFVVPEGVNPEQFHPGVAPHQAVLEDVFTFVSVGKYERRKGMDLLIGAMQEELFRHEVRLLACWANPFIDWSRHVDAELTAAGFVRKSVPTQRVVYGKGKCRIELIGRVRDRRTLSSIMKVADCAVFPYRAEGWGLPTIEAMAMGIPTIATNYSGPTEYLDESNALLLQPVDLEPAVDGRSFKGDRGVWAQVSQQSVIEAMLKAYHSVDQVPTDPQAVAENFNWKKAAAKAVEALEEISAG